MARLVVGPDTTEVEVDGRVWSADDLRRALYQLRPAPPPPRRPHGNSTDVRLVAAMRWDYEYLLFSRGQVIEKYAGFLHRKLIWRILQRGTYPFVEASPYPIELLEKLIAHRVVGAVAGGKSGALLVGVSSDPESHSCIRSR